jgi:hypothetical protein
MIENQRKEKENWGALFCLNGLLKNSRCLECQLLKGLSI